MPARVTVIVPLFNKRDTIARALSSIFSQTEQDFEIVVVDDGSTDGSGEIVAAMTDPRLRLLTQINEGPGKARNVGASAARTSLLAFLDADDEWRPDHLATGLSALAIHPDCSAYVCGYDSGDFRAHRPNKIAVLGKAAGPYSLSPDIDGATLKQHVDGLHSSCVIVRKIAFDRAGGFYDKDRCLYGEDSFLWLRILIGHPIYWTSAEHVRFHVEDSALGYATTVRTRARPISRESTEMERECPPAHRAALKRAIMAFVEMDIAMLTASGAFAEVAMLRRRHGMEGPLTPVIDRLRHARASFRAWRRYLRPRPRASEKSPLGS